MSSIDPATMANQLATIETQKFQQRYSAQKSEYQDKLSAFGKIESALREFRTSVNEMNKSDSGIIKNTASTTEDGFFSASADSKALTGSYQIFVEQVASAHQVSTSMPSDLEATTQVPTTGVLEFTIDGETFTLDLSSIDSDSDGIATIADLSSAINNHPDNPGVNATLVRSNGKTHFMLASEETGVKNAINVNASATGQNWFESAFSTLKEISPAKNAVIWLGAKDTGLKLTESKNTFSNAIEGVDITLKKAQQIGDSAIGMDISADNEGTKEQLNNFVEAYNSLMSTVNDYSKVKGEEKERPILASDPTLRSIESQLKSLVRGSFSGLRLNEIGIEIDRNGKMKIDADKLEKAQLNKSSALENLFNGDDQLLDSIDKAIGPYLQFSSGLFKSRKDSLQESISRVGDKQVALDRKYKMSYDRYIKQFTQMNTLMRQMNQTMSLFG